MLFSFWRLDNLEVISFPQQFRQAEHSFQMLSYESKIFDLFVLSDKSVFMRFILHMAEVFIPSKQNCPQFQPSIKMAGA